MMGFMQTQEEPRKADTRALGAMQTAKKLSSVLSTLRQVDSDLSIVSAHTFALVALAGDQGVYQMDLVDRLGVSKAAVSRAIAALSDRRRTTKGQGGYGLVSLEADPDDIRRKFVRVTPKGKKLLSDIAEVI